MDLRYKPDGCTHLHNFFFFLQMTTPDISEQMLMDFDNTYNGLEFLAELAVNRWDVYRPEAVAAGPEAVPAAAAAVPEAAAAPVPHFDWSRGSPADSVDSVVDLTGQQQSPVDLTGPSPVPQSPAHMVDDDESIQSFSSSEGEEEEEGEEVEASPLFLPSPVELCKACGGADCVHLVVGVTRSGREVMAPARFAPGQ